MTQRIIIAKNALDKSKMLSKHGPGKIVGIRGNPNKEWMTNTTKDGRKHVLFRQTFESLVQLGFDLASREFVLVDPLDEEALRDYYDVFSSEEEAS